jgi:sarcosine oxidase subunit beta
MTPDHHPVIGPVKGLPGMFLANGFSGHGVMHSPATGRIVADLITTGKTDLVEWQLLGIERFAEGRLLHETAVL